MANGELTPEVYGEIYRSLLEDLKRKELGVLRVEKFEGDISSDQYDKYVDIVKAQYQEVLAAFEAKLVQAKDGERTMVSLPYWSEVSDLYYKNLEHLAKYGQPPPPPLTDEELLLQNLPLSQLEESIRQFNIKQEQAKLAAQIEAAQRKREFEADEEFRQWQMRQPAAEQALRQRLWEAEQMAELAGPSDWIKRWELGQGISRREVERNIAAIERDIMKAPMVPTGRFRPVTPGVPTAVTANPEEYDIRGTVPKAILERAPTPNLTRRLQEEEDRLERLKIEQTTAPAPAWLSQFVPSQTTDEPITKQWVRTPSMQLWNTTTPSEQAGLGGYAEWAGGRPLSDIYAHMMAMQPSPIRGAGSRRWQPVRQIY